MIRLQKFLAECGVASRRKAETLIESGAVSVNGEVITKLGSKVDPEKDKVKVNGELVGAIERGILLLHKPINVVTTMSDPQGRPTVAEYMTKHYKSYFPVGRLDFNSSGLVIMTNDGELAERLLHPRYELPRTYRLLVEGEVSDGVLRKIERGVRLEDGPIKGEVQFEGTDGETTKLQITIREGRNRIIRRLMDYLGHPVLVLTRIVHGPFKLGTMRPGEVKKLAEREYQKVRKELMGE